MPKLDQFNVGQFCRELACGIDGIDDVLDTWELTHDQYLELRQNPWFQKELISAVDEIKTLGPNSAFIMKCRTVAETTLPEIFNIIKNERVDPAVRVSAYKQITDLGRLAAPKTEAQPLSGPSVVFNFGPGMPGLPTTLEINNEAALLETPARG